MPFGPRKVKNSATTCSPSLRRAKITSVCPVRTCWWSTTTYWSPQTYANICQISLNTDINMLAQLDLLLQDDFGLEVQRYCAPSWPNPDRPISNTFEVVAMVKSQGAKDGPTVVHDP